MSDLDAILDAALDEFDASAAAPTTSPQPTPSTTLTPPSIPPSTIPTTTTTGALNGGNPASDPGMAAAFEAFLKAMAQDTTMAGGSDASTQAKLPGGESMADMQKEMNMMLQQMAELAKQQPGGLGAGENELAALLGPGSAAASSSSSSAVPALPASSSTPTSTTPSDPINDAIRMIADGARSMPPNGPPGFDMGMGGSDAQMEALLAKLMAEMGTGGGGANGSDDGMDAMVEKMMSGMLSKEYLYQPMKDIADKYPAYIRDNESKLSATDLANYRKQQDCFNRIIHLFDTEANPSMQIMALMNEMQQYGTPPAELTANFMPPGFDPSQPMPPGMVSLAGAGPGGLPPGFPGLPSGPGSDGPMTAADIEAMKKMSEECKVQ